MLFKYLRFLYLNILMIIFIYLNIPLLYFFIFLLKPGYNIWKLSEDYLIFMKIKENIDDDWLLYMDFDSDANFYFRLSKGEHYLWFNCYFYFFFYGGEVFISDIDCLDAIVYDTFDIRNFRYLYKNLFYKENYDKENYFFLYQFDDIYKKRYNLNYNLKLLNKDNYWILNNNDKLSELNSLKKELYIKKIKKC